MAKKILFVMADYPDARQGIFEKYYSLRNAEYAQRHGFEYRVLKKINAFRGVPTWNKFSEVQAMVQRGELRDGDTVTHLDADMVIVDLSVSYETEKSFSYAIDNGNTHCMGAYTMNINPWTRRLLDLILDESRFQKYKATKHWKEFREQASWYSLCGVIPHSYRSFLAMAHNGWHSYPTEDCCFSLTELNKHVEVRGPEWNTTLILEELEDSAVRGSLERYYITPSDPAQTIIRHFAGHQEWRIDGYCTPAPTHQKMGTTDYRAALSIPRSSLVVGVVGAAQSTLGTSRGAALKEALEQREDMYVLMTDNSPLPPHPRAITIPKMSTATEFSYFINSCDAVVQLSDNVGNAAPGVKVSSIPVLVPYSPGGALETVAARLSYENARHLTTMLLTLDRLASKREDWNSELHW